MDPNFDLKYFVDSHRLEENNITYDNTSFETDKIFYKKRIYQQVKLAMKNKSATSDIQEAFNLFCDQCITHFKFIDENEVLQSEYNGLEEKDKNHEKKENFFDLEVVNKTLYIPDKPENLDGFVQKTVNKSTPKIEAPTQKQINIKDDKFRTKGIKKKSNN